MNKDNLVVHQYPVLDGWRGVSILCVLAAHLLPLGPHSLGLNSTIGPLGMVLFFTLSGFLITNSLLRNPWVIDFLIRRFFRIIPLAWLYVILVLPFLGADMNLYLPHLLFYANSPPMALIPGTGHLWSLCVEVQFYIGIACVYGFFGVRGLILVPFICLAFTAYRVFNGVEIAINTYYRVDEILVGGWLALIVNGKLGNSFESFFTNLSQPLLIVLLLISCHPESGFMNYLRPYLAGLLVGSTLYQNKNILAQFLKIKVLAYIAAISYALYVIHPFLTHTWLGSGDKIVEYIKRPLLFMVLFMLAHLSTFYYENRWISIGKSLSKTIRQKNLKANQGEGR